METYRGMLERLKMYRLKIGMMQDEFGRVLGMSQAEYSYKENGKLHLSYENLISLDKAGVNINYLITGEDINYRSPELESMFGACGDSAEREFCMKIFAEALLYKKNSKYSSKEKNNEADLLSFMIGAWDDFSMLFYVRGNLGYSQQQMSEKLGTSIKKYRQIERENTYPDAAMLVDLYNMSGYEPELYLNASDRKLLVIERIWAQFQKEEKRILIGIIPAAMQYI